MKIRVKSLHGHVIVTVPDSTPVNSQELGEAASFLDKIGSKCNAGTVKFHIKDNNGKALGSLEWSPDKDPEK